MGGKSSASAISWTENSLEVSEHANLAMLERELSLNWRAAATCPRFAFCLVSTFVLDRCGLFLVERRSRDSCRREPRRLRSIENPSFYRRRPSKRGAWRILPSRVR